MSTNKAIMQATGKSGFSFPSCDVSWESDFKSLTISLKTCDVIDSGFESPTSPCLGFAYPTTFHANNKTEELEDDLQFEFTEEDLYPHQEHSDKGNDSDDDDALSSDEYDETVISCFSDFSFHSRSIPIPGSGKLKKDRIVSSTPTSEASFAALSNAPQFEVKPKPDHIYNMMKKLSAQARLEVEDRTFTASFLQNPFWEKDFSLSPVSKI